MLDLDLLFGYLHHTAIFLLISVMAAEWVLMRPGIAGERIAFLARVDSAYGLVALLVIGAGVGRVFLGASGADYYLGNWVFWTKMGLFAAAGLASVPPTIAILKWSRALKADAAYAPAREGVMAARRLLYLQFAITLMIPALGLALGKGYGA